MKILGQARLTTVIFTMYQSLSFFLHNSCSIGCCSRRNRFSFIYRLSRSYVHCDWLAFSCFFIVSIEVSLPIKDDVPLIITARKINISIPNNSNTRGIDREHQCVVIARQSKLIWEDGCGYQRQSVAQIYAVLGTIWSSYTNSARPGGCRVGWFLLPTLIPGMPAPPRHCSNGWRGCLITATWAYSLSARSSCPSTASWP